MGCVSSKEKVTGDKGSSSTERHSLGTEARDITRPDCPPPHHDWLEQMLLGIGTNLTSVTRDFSRMLITVKDGSKDSFPTLASTSNDGTLAGRIESVRSTLRALIELSESGVEGYEGHHYYTIKAAVIDSPVDIASTNADTEETNVRCGGDATPPMRADSAVQRDDGAGAVPSSSSGGGSFAGSHTTTTTSTASLALTSDNLALIPDAPPFGKGKRGGSEENARQKRRVAKLLERFDEEWDDRASAFLARVDITGDGGAAADLSGLLMDVLYGSDLCKKVLLTKPQHQRLLGAKWREVFEWTASCPSGEGRTVIVAGEREEAWKNRLGLVGDLEVNAMQKQRKLESTQNFVNMMRANDVAEDKDDAPEEEQQMAENADEDDDPSPIPDRNTTGIPGKQRSTLVRDRSRVRAEGDGAAASSGAATAYVSKIECCMTVHEEGDTPCLNSGRNTTPCLGSTQSGDNTITPHNLLATGKAEPLVLSLAKRTSRRGSSTTYNAVDTPPCPPEPLLLSPPAANAINEKSSSPTCTASSFNANKNDVKRETWIANCRAMDVLFYFSQGVMFHPSQRIRFAFWFPWVSTLRDVGWESVVFTDPRITLDEYIRRSSAASPTKGTVRSFDGVESPFFPGAHHRTAETGKADEESSGNHAGLIFISHSMHNRNYVSDKERSKGDTPEFEVYWSVDIVLDKNGCGARRVNEDTGDVVQSSELKFVDGRLTVKQVLIKTPPSSLFGPSDLWKMRARLLSDHTQNAFGIEPLLVDTFPSAFETGGRASAVTTTHRKA